MSEQCHLLGRLTQSSHIVEEKKNNLYANSHIWDGQSDVPLYFVLYYTLNRSGEIHGKK